MVDDFLLNIFTEIYINVKKEWLDDDKTWKLMQDWVYKEYLVFALGTKEIILKKLLKEIKKRIPKISVLTEGKSRSRRIPSMTRYEVYMRDNGKCVICGSNENIEFDHIIPFSKGGAHSVDNIRVLCRKCNRSRGNDMKWETT